jgi:hypothetical protein
MKTRNAGLAGLVCITDGAARTVLARNSDTARVIVNLPIETHRALLDACRREGITVDALAALIIEGHVATEAASKVVLPDRKAALLVDVPADLHDRLLAAAEAKGMTPDAILAAAVDELLADGPGDRPTACLGPPRQRGNARGSDLRGGTRYFRGARVAFPRLFGQCDRA